MSSIKIEKGNVILSIQEEELSKYEQKGYCKLGATKKVAPKDLQKEINKISKENEKLKSENEKLKNKIEDLEKAQVVEEEENNEK